MELLWGNNIYRGIYSRDTGSRTFIWKEYYTNWTQTLQFSNLHYSCASCILMKWKFLFFSLEAVPHCKFRNQHEQSKPILLKSPNRTQIVILFSWSRTTLHGYFWLYVLVWEEVGEGKGRGVKNLLLLTHGNLSMRWVWVLGVQETEHSIRFFCQLHLVSMHFCRHIFVILKATVSHMNKTTFFLPIPWGSIPIIVGMVCPQFASPL